MSDDSAPMTNPTNPRQTDEDRELIERLEDEEMRLSGRSIDRGCVDSGIAANLAREAAARLESLLSDKAKLEERVRVLADMLLRGTVSMNGHCVTIDFDNREEAEQMFELLEAALNNKSGQSSTRGGDHG
jgi:hypothetical protein